MTDTQTIDQVFAELQTKFRAEKAAGMNATFQFNVTGDNGGEWYAEITDGACTVEKGAAANPTVTITVSAEDWSNIVSGSLNPQMAFMTGKLKVQGDLGLATKLQSLFF
jgi:putative sterol carrier protein